MTTVTIRFIGRAAASAQVNSIGPFFVQLAGYLYLEFTAYLQGPACYHLKNSKLFVHGCELISEANFSMGTVTEGHAF